ncbi:MAG: bacterial Ig-like domain-containing protein [Bacilli bacterium]|nr:bacterial Ig-like domain-containing protein [Bacilli bacterium]
MNKKTLKIAGWALGLSMAVAGIGAAVGTTGLNPIETKAVATSSTTFALINDTADLETGKSYIITNGTSGTVKAISTVTNNNNRKTVDAEVSEGFITRGSDVMSLTMGGSAGAWTFLTENYSSSNGYFGQGNQTGSNYLKIYTSLGSGTNGDTFTISFDGDAAVITSTKKTSRNLMRYNSQSDCFACYSSGQNPVYLWKEVEEESGVAESVSITKNAEPYIGETIQLTATVSYSGEKEDDHRVDWSVVSGNSTVDADGFVTVGDAESVIKATAKDKGEGDSEIYATITLTPLANPITNIAFDTSEAKTEYLTGDGLDISNIAATATYASGNTREYALTKSNFSGFDSSTPTASQTITITAIENGNKYTTTYVISVLAKPAIVFGTNYTKLTSTSQNIVDELGNTWNFEATFTGDVSFTNQPDCMQIGTKTKTVNSLSFTLDFDQIDYTIPSLSAKFGGYNDTAGTISFKLDDVEIASGELNLDQDVTVSASQQVRGKKLEIVLTGLNRLKIYEISYSAFTDAQMVQNFIGKYMHLNDSEYEYDKNNPYVGLCDAEDDAGNTPWTLARDAFNALFPEQRELFLTDAQYVSAKERLSAWATANDSQFGSDDKGNSNVLVHKAYKTTLFNSGESNNNFDVAVALIAGVGLASVAGFFLLRRKKEDR